MGLYKELKEQLGGGDPDACLNRPVCAACFGDDTLKGVVESAASYRHCEFCGAESDEKIAADLLEVIEHINDCLAFYYTTAEEALPYESAEGGYQGNWWTTDVMVDNVLELPNDEDGELREAIVASLGDRSWCRQNPFGLDREEQLRFSWEEFCHHIKHERRFLFLKDEPTAGGRAGDEGLLQPAVLLDRLGELLNDYGLVVDLPAHSRLFRARYQNPGDRHRTARSLGPPPEAVGSRRMSPPGIVMLYVSEGAETALRETADAPATFAIGEFETLKSLSIVDLTRLPGVPSIFESNFDTDRPYRREETLFLWGFADDIAKPINRDDRVHLEYVPTQVITEYVRTAFRTDDDTSAMGIRYSSSRHPGSTSLVLFADRRHVEPSPGEAAESSPFAPEPWIRLARAWEGEVTAENMSDWRI